MKQFNFSISEFEIIEALESLSFAPNRTAFYRSAFRALPEASGELRIKILALIKRAEMQKHMEFQTSSSPTALKP